MKINKILLLILIAVFAASLSACFEEESEGLGNIEVPGTTTAVDPDPEPEDSVIVRKDEEGLVTVTIEDGVPAIYFDKELWRAHHGIPNVTDDPFIIENLNGPVLDACVGKIETMDRPNNGNFITPVVAFILEDGTVDYVYADPYMGEYGRELYAAGGLPWLKDIVTLYYGPEIEGIWGNTIFAVDSSGLSYDIRRLNGLENVFLIKFMCEVEEMPGLELILKLEEDGTMLLDKNWTFGEVEYFKGKYWVYLAEGDDQEWPAGTFRFDYDYIDDSDRDQFNWMGVYSFESNDSYMWMDIFFGEPFSYDKEGAPVYLYKFLPMHFGF